MKIISALFLVSLTATNLLLVAGTRNVLIGDECTNAIDISHSSLPSVNVIETFNYTYNPNDPNSTCVDQVDVSKSTWFKYTAVEAGLFTVNTTYSPLLFDSVIGLLTGSCQRLKNVSCRDRGSGELLSVPVTPGTTYFFKVSEFNSNEYLAEGNGTFIFKSSFESNYLTVINANTDKTINVLKDFPYASSDSVKIINYGVVTESSLTIGAVFNSSVKSVRFTLDNPRRNICENYAPFTVFGSNNGNIAGANIPIGSRLVNATGFAQAQCKGRQVEKLSQRFDVLGCTDLAYYLYDAPTSKYLYNLHNSSFVESPTCNVNIEASFQCGFTPAKVRLELRRASDNVLVKGMDETKAPYYLFGDNGRGKLFTGQIPSGDYIARAIVDGITHPYVQFKMGACNPNPPVDNTFNIDLRFRAGDALSEYENAKFITPMAKRVSSLILGDKPDILNASAIPTSIFIGGKFPPVIDDLNAYIYESFISDGPGGFFTFSFVEQARKKDGLPFAAVLVIDPVDFRNVTSSGDEDLIESFLSQTFIEMLGLGLSSMWTSKGLTESKSPCSYNGTSAVAEFNAITGCSSSTIPLGTNITESPFDDCLFWDTNCLKNEILSYTIAKKKISRITLGALEDLGYVVNYTAADPYGIEDIGVCAGCNAAIGGDMRLRRGMTNVAATELKSSCHSGKAYMNAIGYGQKLRREMYKQYQEQLSHAKLPDDAIYVGHLGGTVTYKHEDGTLCSATVPSDDDSE